MFCNLLEYIEKYLQNKTQKELSMLLALLLGLIFCLVYFLLLPPLSQNLSEQQEAYENLQSNYFKNISHLQNLSQKPKEKLPTTKQEAQFLAILEKTTMDNYALLASINKLNTALNLCIISNISNQKNDIFLRLQGSFENFMEWLRTLEQIHLVFIQDLHIFFEENILTYDVHIKNLGNLL